MYIKSQSFSLFSIYGTKTYLLSYLSDQSCYLKLLSFSNYDLSNIIINSIEIGNIITTNSRDINCFQLNDYIILFYLYDQRYFKINIYNLDLNIINNDITIDNAAFSSSIFPFFKGLHLINNIFALMYYYQQNQLRIEVGQIQDNSSFIIIIKYTFSGYRNYYNELNDFIKINNNRLAYIGKSDTSILSIILFDLYNNEQNMKIRIFYFDLIKHTIKSDFECFTYNNYLSLTLSAEKDSQIYSLFLMFGYVNGTDKIIDIRKYINYNISNNNNLILDLTENVTIDNNIFGYEIIKDKIKLLYLPESIKFFNNNTNQPIESGDILENNYKLKINGDFTNNDNYLEYQIMIIEAEYDLLNNNASEIINCTAEDVEFMDERDIYTRNIFFGRTNTLTFINLSCHEY